MPRNNNNANDLSFFESNDRDTSIAEEDKEELLIESGDDEDDQIIEQQRYQNKMERNHKSNRGGSRSGLKFVENDESVVSSIPNVENVYNETNHGKYNHNNNNNKSPLLQNLFQRKHSD